MTTREKLFDIHCAEGKKLYGSAWSSANIGWFQTSNTFTTKIYNPIRFFTSSIVDGQIVHNKK